MIVCQLCRTTNVHIGHFGTEDFGRTQAAEQHEPGHGTVLLAAKARQQRGGLSPVEPAW